jgi:4-hydroxybenzoate polyprenyltransferase
MSERVDVTVRVAAAFGFGYEAAAIASGGRVPTITSLCLHHRWLAAVMVLSLAAHLVLADYADILAARKAGPDLPLLMPVTPIE